MIIIESGVQTEVWDCCLNTDQYKLGTQISEMAADWINGEMDGKANAVIYTTYQNEDMQNRGQGIQDKLIELCPNVNIMEVVDIGHDVVGVATSTTENMIQKYPDLNCILCYGDASALEATEAVKAAGYDPDQFGIFSCDGTEGILKNIAAGNFSRGTIKFVDIGAAVIEYSKKCLNGETFEEAIDFPVDLVTAENVGDFLN